MIIQAGADCQAFFWNWNSCVFWSVQDSWVIKIYIHLKILLESHSFCVGGVLREQTASSLKPRSQSQILAVILFKSIGQTKFFPFNKLRSGAYVSQHHLFSNSFVLAPFHLGTMELSIELKVLYLRCSHTSCLRSAK